MHSKTHWRTAHLTISLVFLGVASCGGSRIVDNPPDTIVVERPIVSASDQNLHADLNWVIVRNGAGSWVTDADWDEYIINVRNSSPATLRITTVKIFDSLGNELASSSRRPDLVRETKNSLKRYKDQGLEVKAGVGGDALIIAGTATYIAGTATGVAVATGSMAATGATTAAAIGAAFVVAPALVIAGTMRNMENNEIAETIIERQTNLPVMLDPGEAQKQHFFFPIAPSPRRIELTYVRGGEQTLAIDTSSTLRGLHLFQPDVKEQ